VLELSWTKWEPPRGSHFEAANEPTVYWTGDTILRDEVMDVLIEKQ
jgi:hypothetical protein